MAFYDDTGFGTPVNGGYSDIANLSSAQAPQALYFGDQAARYADPFMQERGKYQKQLSDLMANPGSFASSPAYQFAYNQGLEALNRKGSIRSGAKLAALTKYGQDAASQLYFPQAQLLSNLAMSGSSPASAGASYARGAERSQDYSTIGALSRAAGRSPAPSSTQTPWWAQPIQSPAPNAGVSAPSTGVDPYAALNAYNAETARRVSDIGSGKYDDYYRQQYGIGQPSTQAYDPYSDPYWGSGVVSDVYGGYDPEADFYGEDY